MVGTILPLHFTKVFQEVMRLDPDYVISNYIIPSGYQLAVHYRA